MFTDLVPREAAIASKILANIELSADVVKAAKIMATSNNGYVTRDGIAKCDWAGFDKLVADGAIKESRTLEQTVAYTYKTCLG